MNPGDADLPADSRDFPRRFSPAGARRRDRLPVRHVRRRRRLPADAAAHLHRRAAGDRGGDAGERGRGLLGLGRARQLEPRQRRLQDGAGAADRRLRRLDDRRADLQPAAHARPDRPGDRPRLRPVPPPPPPPRARPGRAGPPRKLPQHPWVHGLPMKMRFRKSRLYISALVPLAVGFAVGLIAAIMGVGGAFLMVPAMIYLLGMPTGVVIGTSLFQIIFVTANVTFLQAVQNQTVDVVLSVMLIVGGVIGAQIGSRTAVRLPAEQLRVLLALMVIVVCGRLAYELAAPPLDVYSIAAVGGV